MSKKTRTPQSPEEKKRYWMQRLVRKANSVFPQFQRDINELVEMALHADAEDNERAGIRAMIIDQTLKITARLIPPTKDDYDPTAKPTDNSPGTDQPDNSVLAGPEVKGDNGQKEGAK